MQLNETKITNADEFAKIFHISPKAMRGEENDVNGLAKVAAIPLMAVIECALNRDFLLEKEKGTYYWAFDVKELLKGDMKSRYEAYKISLDANFMQIDEIRFAEDLEPLGMSWVKLGLQDVLYDPKTHTIYTPNTNQTVTVGENDLQSTPDGSKMDAEETGDGEERANPYHDPKNGRFTSGGSKGIGKKEFERVSSAIMTDHPTYKAGERHFKFYGKYRYDFTVKGPGKYSFDKKTRIRNKKK